jgi:hypothetical protein
MRAKEDVDEFFIAVSSASHLVLHQKKSLLDSCVALKEFLDSIKSEEGDDQLEIEEYQQGPSKRRKVVDASNGFIYGQGNEISAPVHSLPFPPVPLIPRIGLNEFNADLDLAYQSFLQFKLGCKMPLEVCDVLIAEVNDLPLIDALFLWRLVKNSKDSHGLIIQQRVFEIQNFPEKLKPLFEKIFQNKAAWLSLSIEEMELIESIILENANLDKIDSEIFDKISAIAKSIQSAGQEFFFITHQLK